MWNMLLGSSGGDVYVPGAPLKGIFKYRGDIEASAAQGGHIYYSRPLNPGTGSIGFLGCLDANNGHYFKIDLSTRTLTKICDAGTVASRDIYTAGWDNSDYGNTFTVVKSSSVSRTNISTGKTVIGENIFGKSGGICAGVWAEGMSTFAFSGENERNTYKVTALPDGGWSLWEQDTPYGTLYNPYPSCQNSIQVPNTVYSVDYQGVNIIDVNSHAQDRIYQQLNNFPSGSTGQPVPVAIDEKNAKLYVLTIGRVITVYTFDLNTREVTSVICSDIGDFGMPAQENVKMGISDDGGLYLVDLYRNANNAFKLWQII